MLRDPNLPHQPILENSGNEITVTCNCRRVKHGTKYTYEAMGIVRDREDTKLLYNNPAMHRNLAVPFGPAWEIHYRDQEPWHGTA